MYLLILLLIFPLYLGTSKAAECTSRGRFPNNLNPDCRGYTMCLSGAASFMKYDVLCPENTIYSHLENQCTNVTSYQCLPSHNCTQEGVYHDMSSENCTSYIECVKDLNDVITARLITCSSNKVFSATESICVNETLYKCQPATEKPHVLHVIINNTPNISGNFSVTNSAIRVFQNRIYVSIISIIALNIIMNV